MEIYKKIEYNGEYYDPFINIDEELCIPTVVSWNGVTHIAYLAIDKQLIKEWLNI